MSHEAYGLIVLTRECYLQISKFVLSHAGHAVPDKAQWREVFGLLGGYLSVGNCIVTDFFEIMVGQSDTEVRFGPAEYVKAVEFEDKLRAKDAKLFHVGWMHSHFIGHTYSGVDIENQLGWQAPNPYAFGLVYDPQLLSDENPGLCILKLEDVNLGEASPVNKLDFVIRQVKGNYLNMLKEEIPEVFEVKW